MSEVAIPIPTDSDLEQNISEELAAKIRRWDAFHLEVKRANTIHPDGLYDAELAKCEWPNVLYWIYIIGLELYQDSFVTWSDLSVLRHVFGLEIHPSKSNAIYLLIPKHIWQQGENKWGPFVDIVTVYGKTVGWAVTERIVERSRMAWEDPSHDTEISRPATIQGLNTQSDIYATIPTASFNLPPPVDLIAPASPATIVAPDDQFYPPSYISSSNQIMLHPSAVGPIEAGRRVEQENTTDLDFPGNDCYDGDHDDDSAPGPSSHQYSPYRNGSPVLATRSRQPAPDPPRSPAGATTCFGSASPDPTHRARLTSSATLPLEQKTVDDKKKCGRCSHHNAECVPSFRPDGSTRGESCARCILMKQACDLVAGAKIDVTRVKHHEQMVDFSQYFEQSIEKAKREIDGTPKGNKRKKSIESPEWLKVLEEIQVSFEAFRELNHKALG